MAPKFTSGEDDELNAFVTIETLSISVEGKVCMWKALKTIEDCNPALEPAESTLSSRGERRARAPRGRAPEDGAARAGAHRHA